MRIALLLIVVVFTTGLIAMNLSTFGTPPSETERALYKDEPNFDSASQTFFNRKKAIINEMMNRNMSFGAILKFFKGRVDAKPETPMPEVKPNLAEFLAPKDQVRVIWFGHSSILLNIDGKVVLVDPVFGPSAAPVSFMVKRFQPPVLSLEELPEIDYILLSHDHYDHLDSHTVRFFKDKKAKFIAPLGVGSHLRGWGISDDRITEKNWWQHVEFEGIKFTATPAQHFSGRALGDRNKTLWASWVIESTNHKLYFSGDSGYDLHFKEIGERMGPFDIAFIENGQYNENWREVHMLPTESVQAFKDLGAKKYFPIHWGMFVLSYHTWREPIQELFKLASENQIDVISPKIGEVINPADEFIAEYWWEKKEELELGRAASL